MLSFVMHCWSTQWNWRVPAGWSGADAGFEDDYYGILGVTEGASYDELPHIVAIKYPMEYP